MRIDPNSPPDHVPAFLLELPEWDEVGPERDSRLRSLSLAQRVVHTLANRIDIREGYEGLEIASSRLLVSM
jgi:hypothetical protein